MGSKSFSKRAATRRFNAFRRRPDVIATARRLDATPDEVVFAMTMQMVKLARAAFSLQLTPRQHKDAVVKLAATSSISLPDLHILALHELEQMLFHTAIGTIRFPAIRTRDQ